MKIDIAAMNITPDVLKRFSINVPRYTSYPTVPEWQDAFSTTDVLEHWSAQAVNGPPLSLYVHIPFCMRLCLYCGCNIIITQKKSRAAEYLDYLDKEIDKAAATPLGKREVVQMHWGGGTPTYLNESELSRLSDKIRSRFKFAANAEVGIEVDPRETSPAKARHLGRIGFNRISMGLQDFDPDVQKAVQRIQPEDMTRAVVDAAREVGFKGLNIDLMYGLPLQTKDRFAKTLEAVLAMNPDRFALFHYAHLPQMIRHQKAIHENDLPSSDEKFAIFCLAVEKLAAAGYEFIGLDHFARPDDELAKARRDGSLNRNFQGYSTCRDADLLSFGVSAISNVANHYVQNRKDLAEYQREVGATGLAPWRGMRMSADDMMRRDLIYRLMCHGRLDKADVERRYGLVFDQAFAPELAEIAADAAEGLAVLTKDAIELTPLGVLFMRNVARRFDAYMRKKEPGRGPTFSKSV